MTVMKFKSSKGTVKCSECGFEVNECYGIATSYSQARWKCLCKDCYQKLEEKGCDRR